MSEREAGQTITNRGHLRPRQVRVLDDTTVNQIAAGEVVERPASVVKELVENSIDAGACSITVSIANGGRSSIEVRDDGCGMSRHDALLAIERFGTSKITSVEDLFSVATHGFRGEALPSIAAVSRFTLTTCEQGQEIGTELSIDGGRLGGVAQRAMTPGTVIQVRNLFYNVPARRAFLRSERTEEGLIRSLFVDFAAAYPQIRFRLLCDGSEVLLFPAETGPTQTGSAQTESAEKRDLASGTDADLVTEGRTAEAPAARGFFERVHALRLGSGLRLEDVLRAPEGDYRVRGVLSRPLDAVSGSGRLRLIVNGRSVRDRLLLRAVRNGYGNFLKADRYPTGVVCVEVPPGEVDVNVHPQKTEIRFRTPNKIFTLLHQAVSTALARADFLTPQSPFPASQGGGFKAPLGVVRHERGPIVFTPAERLVDLAERSEGSTLVGTQQRAVFRARGSVEEPAAETVEETGAAIHEGAKWSGLDVSDSIPSSIPPSTAERSLDEHALRSSTPLQPQQMRYLGQIFRCYLLFEQGEQLVIVDMHAAHERVRFYQLKKQFLSGVVVQQLLAIPEVVELPPDQRERFLECEADLSRLGIQCELFGEHQVVIRSTPAILRGASPRLLLLDLLSLDESESWGGAVERAFDAVIARMACHSSVRSGQELTPQEAYALLDGLNEAERSAFCPHGRPVISALSKYELELRFGRRE